MGLPPIGQPSKENCYDCFYECRAAVMIKVVLGLESVVWLGLVLVSFTVEVSVRFIEWLF